METFAKKKGLNAKKLFCIIFSIKQYMQFCELVKCGGEVVIIISHRLEINQAKLGGEPLHLVKLDCGTSPSLSYGYERSPKVIRKLFANCGPFVML